MKQKIYLLGMFLSIAFLSFSQAPLWAWVNSIGSSGSEQAFILATDASGNVYVCAGYNGDTLILGNDTLFSPLSVNFAVFLVKYNSSGNLISAMNIATCPGTVGGANPVAMKVDDLGNIYIGGMFGDSTITIGGNTTFTNASPGVDDFFLAKFDAAGNMIWAKHAGGDNYDEMISFYLDEVTENIYCTGGFISSTLVLGSVTLTNTNPGNQQVFTAKYDTSGNVIWAQKASNAGNAFYDSGNDITMDQFGNIYVVGEFWGSTITFAGTTLSNTGSTTDIFITKFDAAGNVMWAKKEGTTLLDRGLGCAITTDNKLIVTGEYSGSSITLGSFTLPNAGGLDIFTAKYDSSGNVIWAQGAGGTDSDFGLKCAVNSHNDVFITGAFNSPTISFGSTTLTNAGPNTSSDIFLVKYNSSGNALWAKSAGGNYVDDAFRVATDINDNIFIAGDYWSTSVMFDGLSIPNHGPFASPDAFVAKINATPSGIENIKFDNSIAIFPNPTSCDFTIAYPSLIKTGTIEIFDLYGAKIFSEKITNATKNKIHLKNISPGIYFLKMFTGEDYYSKKIIIEKD